MSEWRRYRLELVDEGEGDAGRAIKVRLAEIEARAALRLPRETGAV